MCLRIKEAAAQEILMRDIGQKETIKVLINRIEMIARTGKKETETSKGRRKEREHMNQTRETGMEIKMTEILTLLPPLHITETENHPRIRKTDAKNPETENMTEIIMIEKAGIIKIVEIAKISRKTEIEIIKIKREIEITKIEIKRIDTGINKEIKVTLGIEKPGIEKTTKQNGKIRSIKIQGNGRTQEILEILKISRSTKKAGTKIAEIDQISTLLLLLLVLLKKTKKSREETQRKIRETKSVRLLQK